MFGKELTASIKPLLDSIESFYTELPDGTTIGTGKNKRTGVFVERSGREIVIEFWSSEGHYRLDITKKELEDGS